ncbi:prepilin-type N-terminal cleavage/methylation domain-containing protein [Virgibacillus subterraneus]|uniref:Prepilin-type N-terminal cleavage/methylation domain-containing protein n=2 Tax=Virgibacillus TaxID=84406 RepID=A0A1H1AU44_9BACI|nr:MULTISPECIES: type II secretion system protein [Virgibacillus]SDQ43235.1 prepilin-type N-terminal cleavage/methylation domain-containing protein [Virgibacillus salinus]SEQ10848.1 prepilin-type N-terminal cleavage/methylation domain-containing protein [Virgibacillus subterraneus]
MKLRQFSTQKGMTLVELLASISLFAVLIALSSTVIIQMINSEDNTSRQISLNQETNVLVSELRNEYTEKSDEVEDAEKFNICYQKIDGLDVKQVITFLDDKQQTKQVNNDCIIGITKQEVLPIEITTANEADQTLTIKTSWRNNDEYVIELKNEEDEKYEFTEDGKFANCDYNQNTRFKNADDYKKVMFIDDCKVNGSAWIAGDIEVKNKTKLVVEKNLYISDNVRIVGKGGNDKAGHLCVKGEIHFPDGKSESDYDIDFKCN